MCWVNVTEEEPYPAPARVKRETRVQRYSSPPRYFSRTQIEERQSAALPLPEVAPPPPRSVRPLSIIPPLSTRAPSIRAPSVRSPSRTRSHYVEVDELVEDSSSSLSSAHEDMRSKTSKTTTNARKSSHSRSRPHTSVYSLHEREREIRRERGYSRPRDDFETYRYIDAPPASDPSVSRGEGRRSYRP